MSNISEYANFILRGDLVAIPTETVYGLGGNAYDSNSIKKIYKVKGRPKGNPLICHVYSFKFAEDNVFDISPKIKIIYKALTDEFWPGPLTIIGKKKPKIAEEVTLSGKVGVRCPNNQLTLSLLKYLEIPIAAPSANRSGHISPTSSKHVMKEFSDDYMNTIGIKVWILDDGDCCNIGLESTVLEYDEDKDEIIIFRCGGISKEQIRSLLIKRLHKEHSWVDNIKISYYNKISAISEMNPISLSPGMEIKHYSPIINTKLIRFISDTSMYKRAEVDLNNTVIIDIGPKVPFMKDKVRFYFSLSEENNYEIACKHLFAVLHKAEDTIIDNFDNFEKVNIYITEFEKNDDISLALWDRVYRASSGRFVYFNLNEMDFNKNSKYFLYH